MFELNLELVAFLPDDGSMAEFLVKDALASRKLVGCASRNWFLRNGRVGEALTYFFVCNHSIKPPSLIREFVQLVFAAYQHGAGVLMRQHGARRIGNPAGSSSGVPFALPFCPLKMVRRLLDLYVHGEAITVLILEDSENIRFVPTTSEASAALSKMVAPPRRGTAPPSSRHLLPQHFWARPSCELRVLQYPIAEGIIFNELLSEAARIFKL